MIIALLMKVFFYAEDPNEVKYQNPIKKWENSDLYDLENPRALIKYSNNMQNFYKNIKEHNPGRKSNRLIPFDDMIADMISNKKLNQRVTELLTRRRKLNISTVLSHKLIFQYQKLLD